MNLDYNTYMLSGYIAGAIALILLISYAIFIIEKDNNKK